MKFNRDPLNTWSSRRFPSPKLISSRGFIEFHRVSHPNQKGWPGSYPLEPFWSGALGVSVDLRGWHLWFSTIATPSHPVVSLLTLQTKHIPMEKMVQHIGCFGRNYPPIKNGKSAAFHHHSPSLTSSLQQVDLVAWPRLPNGISHPPPATGWPGSQERFTPCWRLDNALKTYVMKSRAKTSRVQKAFESYAKGFMYISQWAIYRREGFELHSIQKNKFTQLLAENKHMKLNPPSISLSWFQGCVPGTLLSGIICRGRLNSHEQQWNIMKLFTIRQFNFCRF